MAFEKTEILLFHRVIPEEPVAFGLPSCYRIRGTALTVPEFEATLDAAGPTVPLAAVEDAVAEGVAPPPGAVLTFDDGYREHLEVVTPILVDRTATATFYVATGLHGGQRCVAAVDAWYWLLDHAERAEVVLSLPDGGAFRGRLDSLDEKSAWVVGLPKAALLAAPAADQARMLASLAEAVRCDLPADLASRLYMRAEDWRALVAAGMRVGAHSVTHPRLTQIDDEALAVEVGDSVAIVRSLHERVTFAYPDGAFDARVSGALERAGVTSGVTCCPGWVSRSCTTIQLPRKSVARCGSDSSALARPPRHPIV